MLPCLQIVWGPTNHWNGGRGGGKEDARSGLADLYLTTFTSYYRFDTLLSCDRSVLFSAVFRQFE